MILVFLTMHSRGQGDLKFLKENIILEMLVMGFEEESSPPYRGTRYHLKEFGNNPPQNKRELFNLRHSSLRSTVERCFGVLKKRFRVIDVEPFWSFKTQVDVVLACCIIHNYVKGVDPMDSIMEEVNNEMARNPNPRVQQTQREVQEENREWVSKSDEIGDAMWEDYIARRNRSFLFLTEYTC